MLATLRRKWWGVPTTLPKRTKIITEMGGNVLLALHICFDSAALLRWCSGVAL